MAIYETKLTQAVRHVARGRVIVANQFNNLEMLRAAGRPTEDAEEMLALFLASQRLLERHEQLVRAEMQSAGDQRRNSSLTSDAGVSSLNSSRAFRSTSGRGAVQC